MASLCHDATGPYLVLRFPRPIGPRSAVGTVRRAGPRVKVRLTGWSDDRCAWALHHVERLVHSVRMARPIESATARWLANEAPANLREALAKAGLVDDRRTLSAAVDAWLHAQSPRVSPARLADLERVGAALVAHLGPEHDLVAVTAESLDRFGEQLGPNTRAKHGRAARQFFRWAQRERLIDAEANPAAALATTFRAAAGRVFVPASDVVPLISTARTRRKPWLAGALALARFGGLRVGEILRVTFGDFDAAARSFLVHDTKRDTTRTVPLFPELLDVLGDDLGFDRPGVDKRPPALLVYPELSLLGRRGLSREVLRLAEEARITPWPRLWHNLRASRESELLETFPTKDVLLWIGNTEAVALKHYAMTRDETFARAASTRTTTNPEATP